MLAMMPLCLAAWQIRLLRPPAASLQAPWPGVGSSTSPDMASVIDLRRDFGGAGFGDALLVREQGYQQQLLAEDGSEAIGCAHLGRLAVGGFLVLRTDFILSTVLVKPQWQRQGVGTALVQEVLHRLPRVDSIGKEFRAWVVVDATDEAAIRFVEATGGTACGSLVDVSSSNPLVAAALVVSGGALSKRGRDGVRVFRFAGVSDGDDYDNVGRLERPPPKPVVPGTSSSTGAAITSQWRARCMLACLPFVAPLAAAALLSGPLAARAAIPSFSEYDAVQYKPKRTTVGPAAESELPQSAAEGLRAVQDELVHAAALVEEGRLEDVRVLLRRPLFATFLGYTPGVRGGAGNLKPAAPLVRASTSDEALFELLLDLKRLDDYCLSNRVIIFNDEDLQQVRSLMAAPSQRPENRIDAEEVRGFLEDARQHLKEAAAALKE